MDLLSLIGRHGIALLALICFLEADGLPLPAALALLSAGALAAYHRLHLPVAIIAAVAAIVAGDIMMFMLGKVTGWALLGALCRLSANPETCILRSAESFYRRGKVTLLFAKFVPGINTMAPPLAGSMKMPPMQFLQYDLTGAVFYVLAYVSVGYVFSDFFKAITRGISSAAHALEFVLALAAIAYVVYRIVMFFKFRALNLAPRVPVEEVARRLTSPDVVNIILADVRSHGYYDPGAVRVVGSVRIEPNNLIEEVKRIPKDKDIYVYCT
jgi:membrane protein DedA with SNARE-associated domain